MKLSKKERKRNKGAVVLIAAVLGLALGAADLPNWFRIEPSGSVVAPILGVIAAVGLIGLVRLTRKQLSKLAIWLTLPVIVPTFLFFSWLIFHGGAIP